MARKVFPNAPSLNQLYTSDKGKKFRWTGKVWKRTQDTEVEAISLSSSLSNEKLSLSGTTDPLIRFQENTTDKGYIQWESSNGEMRLVNEESSQEFRLGTNGGRFTGDLQVDGDLFVTGVLTYEDVTNIDSIGIVTARSGIVVTTGGITASSQTITAGSFVGDGSSLTGIDSTAITNGTTNVSTASNSNVTITTAGTLAATFDTSQNLTVAGTVTAQSSIALKDNVETISDALAKVMNLRGVEFDYKANGRHSIGVVAEEVENVFDCLVVETNGVKSVAYQNLTAVLIEAVKELTAQVNTLKTELNILKG